MLLCDFFIDVWWPYQAGRLRACTLEGYRNKWAAHIEPIFGDVALDAITVEALERWLASIPTRGAADGAYAVLRGILRKAVRWGYLDVDPTVRVERPPRRVALKAPVLDAHDVNVLLRGFWGHPLEAWLICSVCLGLRREEGCGLEWRDIDLRSGRVRIQRVVQTVAGTEVVEAPKTELSAREVWLPRFAVLRLRDLKGTGRLVGDLAPDAVARRYKAHCKREGLPWVPPKDLRHSWATTALAAGVDVAIVSRALGHTDISTTARYYLRPDSRVLRDAQKVWARAIVGA